MPTVAHRAARAWRAVEGKPYVWLFLASICFTLAIAAVQHHGETARRSIQVDACERGNVVRAWIRVDVAFSQNANAARVRRATALFPLLACHATVDEHHPVPLTQSQTLAYLSRIRAK